MTFSHQLLMKITEVTTYQLWPFCYVVRRSISFLIHSLTTVKGFYSHKVVVPVRVFRTPAELCRHVPVVL